MARVAQLQLGTFACSVERATVLAGELLAELQTHGHAMKSRTRVLSMHTLGVLGQHRPSVKVRRERGRERVELPQAPFLLARGGFCAGACGKRPLTHAAVSRRPPISLAKSVARTENFTHAAKVVGSCQFPVAPSDSQLSRRGGCLWGQDRIAADPSLRVLQRTLLADCGALSPTDVAQCVWALGHLRAASCVEPALLPALARRATTLVGRFQSQVRVQEWVPTSTTHQPRCFDCTSRAASP